MNPQDHRDSQSPPSSKGSSPTDSGSSSPYVGSLVDLNNVLSVWENLIKESEDQQSPRDPQKELYDQPSSSNNPTSDTQQSQTPPQGSPLPDVTVNNSPNETDIVDHQPDPALEIERKQQLERRLKKKSRGRKKKQINKPEGGPALQTLIGLSPIADQIFKLLGESHVQDGNPLLGMKVLLRLDVETQKQLFHLVQHPILLIESLLMLERISDVSQLLNEFPELMDNALLVSYAEKALIFPNSTTSAPRANKEWRESYFIKPSSSSQSKNDPIINIKERDFTVIWDYRGQWNEKLTGNEALNEEVRIRHIFTSGTPNIKLSLAILDLCKSPKIPQYCIDICDDLSQQICSYDEDNYILGSTIIDNLLQHAKKQLVQNVQENPTSINAKVALVDSYIDDNALLRSLARSKCICRLSLLDLTDQLKLRKLRDSLIQDDRMDVAFKVCTQYNVESEPLFVAWGLSLLKKHNFSAAKDKLRFCFASQRLSRSYLSNLVQNILEVLEMVPDHDEPEGDVQTRPKRFPPETFKDRFELCVQYLTDFGSPLQLVHFYISHFKFEEAIRFLFSKALAANVFIEKAVLFCAAKNQTTALQNAIKKVDPQLTVANPYLMATCNHYNKTGDLKLLLNWQDLMEDHARAGLTCIKLFVESTPTNYAEKQRYLIKSKEHFVEESKLIQGGKKEFFLSPAELNKYIRRIKLQEEISDFFEDNSSKLGATEKPAARSLTIFGSNKQRCEISEVLFEMENYDLASGVIVNFQLPANIIFSNTVNTLLRTNQLKKVKPLLQRGKDIITDSNQWDKFILNCVKIFSELNHTKRAEKFVNLIHSESRKVDAHIICGRLKSAYLIAVKLGERDKVVKIRDEAKAKNMLTELRLCEKYLALADGQTSGPVDET